MGQVESGVSGRPRMSTLLVGSFLTSDQFQCSICLDLFSSPCSIPCGHTFCVECIAKYWDTTRVCQCPLCKEVFRKRPYLHVNRTLKEITDQYKDMTGYAPSSTGGSRPKWGGEGGGGGRGWGGARSERKAARPNNAHGLPVLATSMASSFPDHPSSPSLCSRSSTRRRFSLSGATDHKTQSLWELHRSGQLAYDVSETRRGSRAEAFDHCGHDPHFLENDWTDLGPLLSDGDIHSAASAGLCSRSSTRHCNRQATH